MSRKGEKKTGLTESIARLLAREVVRVQKSKNIIEVDGEEYIRKT